MKVLDKPQQDPCDHCNSKIHTVTCKCGHTHNQHAYAGGCHFCACDGYDQRKVALI